MNATHKLKTINPYFQRVWDCSKTFEVRKNDRDFQAGDNIYLQEYNAETNTYSGREVYGTILYVLSDFDALKDNYCVFSVAVNEWIEPKK